MEKFLEVLKSTDLFSGIAESDLRPLLSCLSAKVVHFGKNQIIFLTGDRVHSFAIVVSGQVQVFQEDYFGNRSIFANLGEGDLIGESFACSELKTLPVSAISTGESDLLFIDCSKLTAPCATACVFHTKLIQNLIRIIAMKNIMLTQKIGFTAKRTTREKLLSYLSAEAQKTGSSLFCIPFNRQELADYLSVDRSAMSAELGKLRDEGVLWFNKNRFELL